MLNVFSIFGKKLLFFVLLIKNDYVNLLKIYYVFKLLATICVKSSGQSKCRFQSEKKKKIWPIKFFCIKRMHLKRSAIHLLVYDFRNKKCGKATKLIALKNSLRIKYSWKDLNTVMISNTYATPKILLLSVHA